MHALQDFSILLKGKGSRYNHPTSPQSFDEFADRMRGPEAAKALDQDHI